MSDEFYNFSEILAKNLKRLRRRENISQMELALRANLSTTFINSIENQQRWVSPSTLSKLAKSLQAYPHELFLSDDAPQNTFTGNSEHQHMITELRDILEKYT